MVVVVVSDSAFTCVAMDTSRADGSHPESTRPKHQSAPTIRASPLHENVVVAAQCDHLLHIDWAHTSSGPEIVRESTIGAPTYTTTLGETEPCLSPGAVSQLLPSQ